MSGRSARLKIIPRHAPIHPYGRFSAREGKRASKRTLKRTLGVDLTTNSRWPTAIRLAEEGRSLQIDFESGESFSLPAEYLRVNSPSAEVQGHGPGQKVTVAGKKAVTILQVAPVGNYAVRLIFDDRHDSGLFTWDYLFRLGAGQTELWRTYLEELAARKLER
jgi:DUF971 family protein